MAHVISSHLESRGKRGDAILTIHLVIAANAEDAEAYQELEVVATARGDDKAFRGGDDTRQNFIVQVPFDAPIGGPEAAAPTYTSEDGGIVVYTRRHADELHVRWSIENRKDYWIDDDSDSRDCRVFNEDIPGKDEIYFNISLRGVLATGGVTTLDNARTNEVQGRF